MHYTAFFEGLSSEVERKLTFILFQGLYKHLNVDQKKSEYTCPDKKIFKILKKNNTFFYYNPSNQLLETSYPKQCHQAVLAISETLKFPKVCTEYFSKLKFYPSETEAYMQSFNGLLFSKTPRIYKVHYIKHALSFDGLVTAKFALEHILIENSGLVIGHDHSDFSSYIELGNLLAKLKEEGIKIAYLELSCRFNPLFENFNNNKSGVYSILTALKPEIIRVYKSKEMYKSILNGFKQFFLAAKNAKINIYPCDVDSLNFSDHVREQINVKHRLEVGNACMIRSIEKLQSDHKHPKFLVLVGLAHAKNIAQELGVPSCAIGDKNLLQDYQRYTKHIDNIYLTQSRSLYSSGTRSSSYVFDQSKDPKIKEILEHWDKLTQKMPVDFSVIPIDEVKKARGIYIEFILEQTSINRGKISNICISSQLFLIEQLKKAIYAKCTELVHPKNWFSLFRCHRPYGIRLTEKERDAFTLSHLNDLVNNKPTESSLKLHYA